MLQVPLSRQNQTTEKLQINEKFKLKTLVPFHLKLISEMEARGGINQLNVT